MQSVVKARPSRNLENNFFSRGENVFEKKKSSVPCDSFVYMKKETEKIKKC